MKNSIILICFLGFIHLLNAQKYQGPIIDMHIHAYAEGNPMFGMTHPPTLRGKTYKGARTATEQQEKTLEKFKKHHIVKAVVTNGDFWNVDDKDIILTGKGDGEIDMLRELHKAGKLHVIGEMAPFYQGVLANEPKLEPFYALAEELEIPVGIHMLPGGPNSGIHLMPRMLGGMRVYNANPTQLEDILVKFPGLKLYIMHGGWPYVEDIKALMYAHPKVYVDIAVLNWILPQAELGNYLKSLFDAGFGNRILFGTDQMVWPDTIDDAVESVNALEFLSMDQKEDIFYDNASEFLGLSPQEIKEHKGE